MGTALLIRDAQPLRAHRAGWYGVVVAVADQRRGIARRLLVETLSQTAALGIEILETSARSGEPAEEVYRRLGFQEWGHLPGGMHRSWGKVRVFDEVYFYLPVAAASGKSIKALHVRF